MGFRQIGFKSNRFAVACNRVTGPPKIMQDLPQVIMVGRIPGIDLDGGLDQILGHGLAPGLMAEKTQQVQRFRMLGPGL